MSPLRTSPVTSTLAESIAHRVRDFRRESPASHRRRGEIKIPMSCFTVDTSEPDLTELSRFLAAQTDDSAERIQERLQWQVGNPSRSPDVPFAWCARTKSGTLGGAMLCMPHRLIKGGQNCTALMSHGFYVDASLRGAGMEIFLQYRAQSERYVLYTTTANAQAGRLWEWAGAKALVDTDHELLRPVHWSSMAEEMLVRRLGMRWAPVARVVAPLAEIRRVAVWTPLMGELTPVHCPEDAVIAPVGDGVQPVRDVAFIRWRFFDVPQAEAQIYHYREENLGADGFVALTQVRRGYRRQIRTLFLADMWGEIPPGAFPRLLSAISKRYRATVDVLAMRCLDRPYMRDALAAKCLHRGFGYATGWYIDRRSQLGPDPVLMPAGATEPV